MQFAEDEASCGKDIYIYPENAKNCDLLDKKGDNEVRNFVAMFTVNNE